MLWDRPRLEVRDPQGRRYKVVASRRWIRWVERPPRRFPRIWRDVRGGSLSASFLESLHGPQWRVDVFPWSVGSRYAQWMGSSCYARQVKGRAAGLQLLRAIAAEIERGELAVE